MKWKKYTITTTTAAEDLVSGMLMELGMEGVEIEDNIQLSENDTKAMFVDILPELPPDDGIGKVSFYLDDDDSFALVQAHLPILEAKLAQKGYNSKISVSNESQKVDFVEDFLKKDQPSAGQVHRYSFDMRA